MKHVASIVTVIALMVLICSGCMSSAGTDDSTGSSSTGLMGSLSGGDDETEASDIGGEDTSDDTSADDDSSADDTDDDVSGITFLTKSISKKATVGKTYSGDTIKVKGGSGTYVWEFSGDLPAGLTCNKNPCNEAFDAKKVVLGGKPTEAGTFSFTVLVTDLEDDSISEEKDFSLVVKNASSSGSGTGTGTGTGSGTVLTPSASQNLQGKLEPVSTSLKITSVNKSKIDVALTSIKTKTDQYDKGPPVGTVSNSGAYSYRLKASGGTAPYIWEWEFSVHGGEMEKKCITSDCSLVDLKITKLFAKYDGVDDDPVVNITVTVRDSGTEGRYTETTLVAVVAYPLDQTLGMFHVFGGKCEGYTVNSTCKSDEAEDGTTKTNDGPNDNSSIGFYHDGDLLVRFENGGCFLSNIPGDHVCAVKIQAINDVWISPGHDDKYVSIRSEYWELLYKPSPLGTQGHLADMDGYEPGDPPTRIWKRLKSALPPIPAQ